MYAFFRDFLQGPRDRPAPTYEIARCARCDDLERRLADADAALKQRSQLLYDLQKQYSSEHLSLCESARDLRTERGAVPVFCAKRNRAATPSVARQSHSRTQGTFESARVV